MGQLQMHYCCCLNYFFQVNKFLKKWVRKTGSYLSPLKTVRLWFYIEILFQYYQLSTIRAYIIVQAVHFTRYIRENRLCSKFYLHSYYLYERKNLRKIIHFFGGTD